MGRATRIISGFLVVMLTTAVVPAFATPISVKRAEARRIQAQIESLETKAEIATEDWNEARIEYNTVHGQVQKLEQRLTKIKKRMNTLQTSLNTRVDSMYRSGPLGLLDVLLGAVTFDDFASTWDFLNEQNRKEASTVAELKSARIELVSTEAELKTQQSKAKKVYDVMSARRNDVLRDEAEAKRLLKGVEKEINALLAPARQRRSADARRAGGSGRGTGWNWGDPARAPRSGVVRIALKYLGRPYRWAAAGPNAFDCSGFTMFVYAQVGVSLPHSSRAQIGSGPRVSRSNLRPGDLVFFGSPIHHVGIYIGNGKMVHSPHSGDVVSIDPVFRSDYAGACRP